VPSVAGDHRRTSVPGALANMPRLMRAAGRLPPGENRALFACYLMLIFWVPIPLGSNRPWSWALLEIWVFALATWWLAANLRAPPRHNRVLKRAWPALLCSAFWLGYVWLQLLPLPMDMLRVLSPEAARWHAAAAWPQSVSTASLTLDRYETLQGASKSTAYIVFFWLSLALLDGRRRITAAAWSLVLSGIIQAAYGGILALSEGADAIAHGAFVNRNHFAGYLELCLSMGLGLLIASLTGEGSSGWKQFLRNMLAWMLSPRMLLRMALLVMVIALVLSRSRMGNTAFFASMLVCGAIGLVLSKHATRSMVIVLVSVVIIDIALVGARFGAEKVVERLERTQVETERNEAKLAIGVWKDFPVFGSGLASFYGIFPRYKDGHLAPGFYDRAHNDYVQFASETGLVGISLVGLLVLMSFAVALRAQQVRRDPLMRGISFGAMMGILALMIHSWVDFNLQIPANALTFMLILAFAWIALYHGPARMMAQEAPGRSGPPARRPNAD
jgi:O-antigen ligase